MTLLYHTGEPDAILSNLLCMEQVKPTTKLNKKMTMQSWREHLCFSTLYFHVQQSLYTMIPNTCSSLRTWNKSVQPSKFIFFLSGHFATDCSSLVASEKFSR